MSEAEVSQGRIWEAAPKLWLPCSGQWTQQMPGSKGGAQLTPCLHQAQQHLLNSLSHVNLGRFNTHLPGGSLPDANFQRLEISTTKGD